MATKYKCKGMSFNVDKVGSGTTFTKITQATSIGLPSPTNDPVDDTDLDSDAVESSPGLPDNGEIAVEFRFDPDDLNHTYVEDWANAPVKKPVRVTIPTLPKDTYYTFNAFPTGFDRPGGTTSDPLTATLGLKISGAVVKSKAP